MLRHFVYLFMLITLARISSQEEIAQKIGTTRNSYNVTLIMYEPTSEKYLPEDVTSDNVDNLIAIIEEICEKHQKQDIIVLPEYALLPVPSHGDIGPPQPQKYDPSGKPFSETEHNPDKGSGYVAKLRSYFRRSASNIDAWENSVICLSNAEHVIEPLKKLSCVAEKVNAYLVVNTFLWTNCVFVSNCPPDHIYLRNANIVFDRSGKIAAIYYKHITYDEPWIDTPIKSEMKTFTTDFDVTFGLLIGDDFKFSDPADSYASHESVTDVILTTRAYDYVPFLRSVQDFSVWASKTNLNLLVAGYTWDGAGGIYMGKNGPLRSYVHELTTKFAIIERVPKRKRDEYLKLTNYSIYKFSDVELNIKPEESLRLPKFQPIPDTSSIINAVPSDDYYESIEISSNSDTLDERLCVGENNCCYFNLTYTYDYDLVDKSHDSFFYIYRIMMVRNIYQWLTDSLMAIENCIVIACTNDKLDSCGKKLTGNVIYPLNFTSIMITRSGNTAKHIYGPVTTSVDQVLLNKLDYNYLSGSPSTQSLILLYLTRPINDLMIFGINGRRLDENPEAVKIYVAGFFKKFVSAVLEFFRSVLGIICLAVLAFVIVLLIVIRLFHHKIVACYKRKKRNIPKIIIQSPSETTLRKENDERDSFYFCCLYVLKYISDLTVNIFDYLVGVKECCMTCDCKKCKKNDPKAQVEEVPLENLNPESAEQQQPIVEEPRRRPPIAPLAKQEDPDEIRSASRCSSPGDRLEVPKR